MLLTASAETKTITRHGEFSLHSMSNLRTSPRYAGGILKPNNHRSFWNVSEEISGREIMHTLSKSFPSAWNRKAGVFKFHRARTFSKSSAFVTVSAEGRPHCSNKSAFSNFFGLGQTLPGLIEQNNWDWLTHFKCKEVSELSDCSADPAE